MIGVGRETNMAQKHQISLFCLGTYLNGKRIESRRYYQLLQKVHSTSASIDTKVKFIFPLYVFGSVVVCNVINYVDLLCLGLAEVRL